MDTHDNNCMITIDSNFMIWVSGPSIRVQKRHGRICSTGYIPIYCGIWRLTELIRFGVQIISVSMRKGFLYLVAVMDWYSRKMLSWCLSNSLDTASCIEALEEALANYGVPTIFNSDQGCQFTSEAFIAVFKEHGVKISMDGKGRWMEMYLSNGYGTA